MANNEKSSPKTASLASKALRNPGSLSKVEIKSLGGAVLTQAPDKSRRK